MEPPIPPLLFAVLCSAACCFCWNRPPSWHRAPPEGVGRRAGQPGHDRGCGVCPVWLVVAFTFSGAASRFNEKRMLIAEEANTIETAYLRLHCCLSRHSPNFKSCFAAMWTPGWRPIASCQIWRRPKWRWPNPRSSRKRFGRSSGRYTAPEVHPDAGKLLLPALNNMIDITTTRAMALQTHPPKIVYALLFGLGLICSLLAGYRMSSAQHRSWLHIFGFAVITVIIVYVMLDAEYPARV